MTDEQTTGNTETEQPNYERASIENSTEGNDSNENDNNSSNSSISSRKNYAGFGLAVVIGGIMGATIYGTEVSETRGKYGAVGADSRLNQLETITNVEPIEFNQRHYLRVTQADGYKTNIDVGTDADNRIGLSLDKQLQNDIKQKDSEYGTDVDKINSEYDNKRNSDNEKWNETMSPLDKARDAWGFKDPVKEAKEKADKEKKEAAQKQTDAKTKTIQEAETKRQALYKAGIKAIETRNRIMGDSN